MYAITTTRLAATLGFSTSIRAIHAKGTTVSSVTEHHWDTQYSPGENHRHAAEKLIRQMGWANMHLWVGAELIDGREWVWVSKESCASLHISRDEDSPWNGCGPGGIGK